jgi:hypothetical protein
MPVIPWLLCGKRIRVGRQVTALRLLWRLTDRADNRLDDFGPVGSSFHVANEHYRCLKIFSTSDSRIVTIALSSDIFRVWPAYFE